MAKKGLMTCLLFWLLFSCPSLLAGDKSASDLFDLSLDELLQVNFSVASNVDFKNHHEPSSITVISRQQISLSGARTLNELLSSFVPGYFMVEDQDDTIAGFRGLVPDNNSKTLLLLNGNSLNAEWFWGAPDSMLNGIDLNLIERVEVIRGPGSVTLGQGALLGVINIITHQDQGASRKLAVHRGQDGYELFNVALNFQSEFVKGHAYFAKGNYEGQRVRDEGWAHSHQEQGLTVFERQHHLKRSNFNNAFVQLSLGDFSLEGFQFDQERDLYQFFRDREVVHHSLKGLALKYEGEVAKDTTFSASASYAKDDYALRSHGGNLANDNRLFYEQQILANVGDLNYTPDTKVTPNLTMGGTREYRQGLKGLLHWKPEQHSFQFAMGLEYMNYRYGRRDGQGNNYILNEEIQTLGLLSDGQGGFIPTGNPNLSNTWVKPFEAEVLSTFAEASYELSSDIELFVAFRYDSHPEWGSHVSPRLGGFYQLLDHHLFRLSWQTGFRGAVGVQFAGGFVQDGFLAQENFSVVNEIAETQADFNWDGIASNDSAQLNLVEPETIENLELAYYYLREQFSFDAVLFHTTVEDILTAQAHGYEGLGFGDTIGTDLIATWNGNWYYQNQQGQLKQKGLEFELAYQFEHSLISASHAYVDIYQADRGTVGVYVIEGEKNAAYPEHISRLHLQHQLSSRHGHWQLHYNHLYYWGFHAPTGDSMPGAHIASFGLRWQPKLAQTALSLDLVVKNLWQANALYPINGTGDRLGAEGAPAIEARNAWLALTWQF